ncbi:tetratricopeptide repeat protein [Bermanella sp. R86510]|uniref:tetratricopeptide repeat protein n=1 Tax=unclassified Bermanella TaxID=2627862 RepID=UPI0037C51896
MMLLPKYIKPTLYVVCVLLSGCFGGQQVKPNVEADVSSTRVEIPSQAAADFKIAIGHMNSGDYNQAEVAFKKLTEQYPVLSGPYANLGVIYSQREEWDEATEYLTKAIEKNPKNVKARNQLGWVYRQQGKFEQAEEQYRQAIEQNPEYAASHRNLGILYDIYMGNLVKASEHYQSYQSLQSEPDRQVAGWLVDIKRRANIESQLASEAQ